MGSQHEHDTCGSCGIVRRMHGPGLAGCGRFTAAADDLHAMDATEAARAAGEHRERTYNDLRRAVQSWRLTEAREIIEELMAGNHG